MVPLYSLLSFLSLLMEQNSVYFDTFRDWCACRKLVLPCTCVKDLLLVWGGKALMSVPYLPLSRVQIPLVCRQPNFYCQLALSRQDRETCCPLLNWGSLANLS